ncbi:MAG: hypothetical protein E7546_05260 [Ruminococcaceae bacterium]|nr:hypothetical protein [Oscillospiraceae bacterium]
MKKEKKGSSQIASLFKTGFFHVFSSNMINKMISFLSGIVLVRLISKADYGVYSYANNILSFFVLITGMGMASGAFQLICERAKHGQSEVDSYSKKIYFYACRSGTVFNLFLAVIIVIFSLFVTLKIEGSNDLLILLALYPVVTLAASFQKIYLRADFKNKEFSYANTLEAILMLVFSIAGAYIYGTVGLIIAHYLACACSIILTRILFGAPFGFKSGKIEPSDRSALYKISIITMVNNGFTQMFYLLDVFVIGFVLANDEIVASYKIATVIPTALHAIPGAITTYIYPFFASKANDVKWLRKRSLQLFGAMGIVNLVISAVLIIFAPQIITLIFGKQYLDAVTCFRILSLGYFFDGTFKTISGNLLVTQRKLKFNLFIAVTCGIINTVGNFILVNMLGMTGAAVTTIIVILTSSLLSTVMWFFTLRKKKEALAANE